MSVWSPYSVASPSPCSFFYLLLYHLRMLPWLSPQLFTLDTPIIFSEHLGCYKISAENRVFVSSPGDYDMEDISPLHCLRQCGTKYRYATLQEGNVCLCANTLPTAGQVNDSECNMTCPGHDSWPINDQALRWEKFSWSFIFRRFPCSLWRFCDCERKNQWSEGRRILEKTWISENRQYETKTIISKLILTAKTTETLILK